MGSSFKGKDIIFYYGIRFFFFLVCAESSMLCRLLIAEASLVWHMGSRHTGLEVVASGL